MVTDMTYLIVVIISQYILIPNYIVPETNIMYVNYTSV